MDMKCASSFEGLLYCKLAWYYTAVFGSVGLPGGDLSHHANVPDCGIGTGKSGRTTAQDGNILTMAVFSSQRVIARILSSSVSQGMCICSPLDPQNPLPF